MNQSPSVEERLEWQWGERFLETCVDHAMNMGRPARRRRRFHSRLVDIAHAQQKLLPKVLSLCEFVDCKCRPSMLVASLAARSSLLII